MARDKQLRSRATPQKQASESKSPSAFDSKEKEAWNAKLSDRRRRRREERLGQQRKGDSNTTASGKITPASPSLRRSTTNGSTGSTPAATKVKRRLLANRKNSSKSSSSLIYGTIMGCLVIVWVCGFWILTTTTNSTDASNNSPKGPIQFLRKVEEEVAEQIVDFESHFQVPPMAVEDHDNSGGADAPPERSHSTLKANEKELVDMRDLNAHLTFDNTNGGVWTQGWDVEPVPIGKNEKPLRIFVVPHSHCDPGWIKTFDEYFQSQTKGILSSVITTLAEDPQRRFIWAEISYFEWWWKEQDESTRDHVRQFLKEGRFEFVTGGWVQPDEANTQLYAMEIQLQEGHDFIRQTFGEECIPKYGWSIDPFGYSPTMAYLLKKYNFEAMLIQRVHYRIKKELAQSKHLEFMWRQTWDDQGDYDIFTHVMPFYSYDVPHTCGPEPGVCCTFDFARMRGMTTFAGACPWGKQPQPITDANVAERAHELLGQYRKKANLYRSNVVIAPLGDDFRYRTPKEANAQFENYQRLFDYINKNIDGVTISFGTLSEYFKAAMGTFQPPLLKGAFFTYADREEDYWSGYFTSRVFDKALDRQLERVLYAATTMGASKTDLQEARRALSLFQHHDGVTGTAKTHVVEDYAARIHKAIHQCQEFILKQLRHTAYEVQVPRLKELTPCWKTDAPRGLTQNFCGATADVLVYNPLLTEQECGSVKVPPGTVRRAQLPCQTPGKLPNFSTDIQFDPHTGLMTHPVKEEWMVWKVKKGGAYLFFPGRLSDYDANSYPTIEDGGYVVETKYWKRKVIERTETVDGVTATILDFEFETFLQETNQEWLVRFTGDNLQNEGVFHTDLNGYNFDTHHFRADMPIQSQVFPMPTHASIEDAHQRMTILSEHAQGTASLEEGAIDVWLDRRLGQDDERGLGQGVLDNVPTRTRLRVILETEGYEHASPEFVITPRCKKAWKELNHPLEVFGMPESSSSTGIMDLPADYFDKVSPSQAAASSQLSVSSSAVVSAFKTSKIPVVYMVYKRVDYLQQAIDSLLASDYPLEKIPIVISQDGHIPEMMAMVQDLQTNENYKRLDVLSIIHPHSCSDHPSSFPGDDPRLNENYKGDAYGNPREGKVTCCKHHFTWLMNEVFGMDALKDADGFLFMEEDYIVAPTIYETINSGLTYLDEPAHEGKYFGITLDPTEGYSLELPKHAPQKWVKKRFVTGPMVLRRDIFAKIKEHAQEYCTIDEYNWDWSIVHLMGKSIIPHLVIVPRILQVAHIGLEGGLHEDSINARKRKKMEHQKNLKPFHEKPPTDDETTDKFQEGGFLNFQTELHKHDDGFGGWGHPADQQHCISLFDHAAAKSHKWSHFLGLPQ